jgi:hypothetical protein
MPDGRDARAVFFLPRKDSSSIKLAVVEPNGKSEAPRSFLRLKSLIVFVVFAAVLLIGGWAVFHFSSKTEPGIQTNSSQSNVVPAMPPVLFTNQAALIEVDPRWSGVVGVLKAMKEWDDANPVCHMLVTTEGMGDKTYVDTEMFRYFGFTPGNTNLVTLVRVHLRFPNEVTFLFEKEGEEVIAYLPESDQLLKVDASKEISAQYGLDLQKPNIMTFLNMLRIAFVETNGTQRAMTFAFKPEFMNVPSAASVDAFTTFHIDQKGALQSIEQTLSGEHHVMRIKYLGFQQEEVSRNAPQIPADKPVITGKAFNIALQEEIMKLRDKGTRIKI